VIILYAINFQSKILINDTVIKKMKIKVLLYYHLKEKAGTGTLDIDIKNGSTIKDLKDQLAIDHPGLRTHLDNVMILVDGKIVLNEDKLIENSSVSFLTPVGGG